MTLWAWSPKSLCPSQQSRSQASAVRREEDSPLRAVRGQKVVSPGPPPSPPGRLTITSQGFVSHEQNEQNGQSNHIG